MNRRRKWERETHIAWLVVVAVALIAIVAVLAYTYIQYGLPFSR